MVRVVFLQELFGEGGGFEMATVLGFYLLVEIEAFLAGGAWGTGGEEGEGEWLELLRSEEDGLGEELNHSL
jgi:hypothetical protein